MTKQEQLRNSVDKLNTQNSSGYKDWILLLLTSIADSIATIADDLSDTAESEVEDGKIHRDA